MRALLATAAIVIASASVAHAQYGYYVPSYGVPVAPVVPYDGMYFSSPQLGTFAGGGGYTYFSNNLGTFGGYNPVPYANSVMAQQQAWRTAEQIGGPVQQPRASHRSYRGW